MSNSEKNVNELVDDSKVLLRRIGDYIKSHRAELPVREYAEMSKFSKSFINNLERGEGNPTWASLAEFCSEMDISLAECIVRVAVEDNPDIAFSDATKRRINTFVGTLLGLAKNAPQSADVVAPDTVG